MARIRVGLNGGLGTGGPEVWSVGFNFVTAVAPSAADAQAMAEQIRDDLAAQWATSYTDLRTLLSNRGDLRSVDVYGYGTSGPAVSSGQAVMTTPLVGSAVLTMPPQACAVFSLQTDLPGPSYRGRTYWPALGASISADLKSSTAKQAGEDLVELVRDIETSLEVLTPVQWAVYSPKLGVLTPVSRVRAGDVIDTQRRRRDALVETFTVTPF